MLRKIVFNENMLERVQGFRCGDQPWEIEVSDWIKAGRDKCGAVDDIAAGKCEVWLYENENAEIVGFSSLGATQWKYPGSTDKKQQISIIPNVAIASSFQGKGLARTIFEHIFSEAKSKNDRLPLIGLYVDPRNDTAIGVYRRFGFDDFHQAYKDRVTNVTYKGMICRLP